MMAPSVFIIVPCFNESEVIRSVANDLISQGGTVVIVDDGSEESLEDLLNDLPVIVLTHPVNLGQGAALQTGVEYALNHEAQVIVHFDGDGQHLAGEIEEVIRPILKEEVDVVLGSRFLTESKNNIPATKRIMLNMARFFNLLISGFWLSDAHNGFRAFSAKAAEKCVILENSYAHATEILHLIKKHRINFVERPVTINYSDYSRKKGQSIFNSINIFFDVLIGNKIP